MKFVSEECIKLTVFTPTYNRGSFLPRIYDFLLKEECGIIEWLIIDDGSTDETKQIVNQFKETDKLYINYYYQENGGKYRAYNRAIDKAKGEFFMCLDSDDIYVEGSFKELISLAEDLDYQAGLVYPVADINNPSKVIGTGFPNQISECNSIDLYYKYGVRGDTAMITRTSVIKKYKFPVIEGEKFVTETVLYAQIAKDYKYKLINKPYELVDYQPTGMSKGYRRLVKNNPKGSLINYKTIDQFDLRGMALIRNTVRYVSFVFYNKNGWFENFISARHKVMYLLCTPFALVVSKMY